MSHYSQLKSSIKNVEAFVKSLVACGVPRECIEVHKEAVPLRDWHDNRTSYRWKDAKDARFKDGDKAHVIVRRSSLDRDSEWSANNDWGVYIDGDDSVIFTCEYMLGSKNKMFKSEESQRLDCPSWLKAVKHRYQFEVCKAQYPTQQVQRAFVNKKQHLFVKA